MCGNSATCLFHDPPTPPPDKSTRAMLRHSTLMDKVSQLRTSMTNSVEVSQLAEAAFNNLKVSVIVP